MTDDRPTSAIRMASAENCADCGSDMRPDQRYCVECGARRGQARFGVERGASAAGPVVAVAPSPGLVRRLSSGTTLLTGLAVLLLALGVGVMIGRGGNATALAGKPTYTFNVGAGAGAGGSTSGGGSSAPTSGSSKSGSSKSKSSKSTTPSAAAAISGKSGPTVNQSALHTQAQRKAAVKKLTSTKVQLNNGKSLAPATQSMGGKCSAGTVGCQNGKFTGSFFGGG